ncbi:hypothetical protein PVK73_27940 [Bacillus thuringiensis]
MKRNLVTCMMLTSIMTGGGAIPLNVLTNSIVHAKTEQVEIEQEEHMDFAVDSAEMKTGFEKTREFAQAMNEYSYKLLNTPDVTFQGIDLGKQDADLP